MANEVKFRLPASKVYVFWVISGRLLAGFVAYLHLVAACLIFFRWTAVFLATYMALAVFMVLGVYTAIKQSSPLGRI